MELIYLILPILGAFILLFIVCCCGSKVKMLFHIPKEIVTGGYRIAADRDVEEDPARLALTTPPMRDRRTSMRHHSPFEADDAGQVFSEDISKISERLLHPEPTTLAPRLSERDSGVYSVCDHSLNCVSTQGTPCPKTKFSGHFHNEESQLRTDDAGSCVLSVRSRTCSGDTHNTGSIQEIEYEMEDAGICIIHVPLETDETDCDQEQSVHLPDGSEDVSHHHEETENCSH